MHQLSDPTIYSACARAVAITKLQVQHYLDDRAMDNLCEYKWTAEEGSHAHPP